MNPTTRHKLLCITYLITILGVFLGVTGLYALYQWEEAEQATFRLPAPIEVQQELIRRGYDIKADGVIGRQTIAAWDQAYCNQCAVDDVEYMSKLEAK